jgi:hypothetical protein
VAPVKVPPAAIPVPVLEQGSPEKQFEKRKKKMD